MGVSSKLFVTCKKEDVIQIGNSVSKALEYLSRAKLDNYWKNNTDAKSRMGFLFQEKYKEQSRRFTNNVSISSFNFDTFVFNFGSGEDMQRSLYMFPTCSDDYNEASEGYKVIFSIGHWGNVYEILKVVAESVREYGEVYVDYNDCDEYNFFKVDFNV